MFRGKVKLPSAEMQQKLRGRYGELTVVPLLTKEDENGQIQCVIVRPVNRKEWREINEWATSMAQNSNQAFEEALMDKAVEKALVWPEISRLQFDAQRAGFIPSVYGVVEKISWFFPVEQLLNCTFSL
jgi:hypothetical protein